MQISLQSIASICAFNGLAECVKIRRGISKVPCAGEHTRRVIAIDEIRPAKR